MKNFSSIKKAQNNSQCKIDLEYLEHNDKFAASVREVLNEQIRQNCRFLEDHIFEIGWGKMLRTRFLASMIDHNLVSSKILRLSAAIELLHTASLFHDDIVDNADTRRGKPALWKKISIPKAVLAGDLLLSIALFIVENHSNQIVNFLKAIQMMSLCELDRELTYEKELNIDQYLNILSKKTGNLFSLCTQCLDLKDFALCNTLYDIGNNIGVAYQICDDLLDEFGDAQIMGKNLFKDKMNGIHTIAHCENPLDSGLSIVDGLLNNSIKLLDPWKNYQSGLKLYLNNIFWPTIIETGHINNPIYSI